MTAMGMIPFGSGGIDGSCPGPQSEGCVMEFITDLIDYNAPEIIVMGVASVVRISVGIVRVTLYSRQKEGNVAKVHLFYDWAQWMKNQALYRMAQTELARPWYPPPEEAMGDEARH